jgi:hypothetical protein
MNVQILFVHRHTSRALAHPPPPTRLARPNRQCGCTNTRTRFYIIFSLPRICSLLFCFALHSSAQSTPPLNCLRSRSSLLLPAHLLSPSGFSSAHQLRRHVRHLWPSFRAVCLGKLGEFQSGSKHLEHRSSWALHGRRILLRMVVGDMQTRLVSTVRDVGAT